MGSSEDHWKKVFKEQCVFSAQLMDSLEAIRDNAKKAQLDGEIRGSKGWNMGRGDAMAVVERWANDALDGVDKKEPESEPKREPEFKPGDWVTWALGPFQPQCMWQIADPLDRSYGDIKLTNGVYAHEISNRHCTFEEKFRKGAFVGWSNSAGRGALNGIVAQDYDPKRPLDGIRILLDDPEAENPYNVSLADVWRPAEECTLIEPAPAENP